MRKLSELNNLISTPEHRKATQLCHVNLLKPYNERSSQVSKSGPQAAKTSTYALCSVVRESVITSPLLDEEADIDGLPPADGAFVQA